MKTQKKTPKIKLFTKIIGFNFNIELVNFKVLFTPFAATQLLNTHNARTHTVYFYYSKLILVLPIDLHLFYI